MEKCVLKELETDRQTDRWGEIVVQTVKHTEIYTKTDIQMDGPIYTVKGRGRKRSRGIGREDGELDGRITLIIIKLPFV